MGIDVLVSCAAGDPMVFVRVPLERERENEVRIRRSAAFTKEKVK